MNFFFKIFILQLAQSLDVGQLRFFFFCLLNNIHFVQTENIKW